MKRVQASLFALAGLCVALSARAQEPEPNDPEPAEPPPVSPSPPERPPSESPAPPEPPAEPEPPVAEDGASAKDKPELRIAAAAGYASRHVYDVAITAADIQASAGFRARNVLVLINLDFIAGSTEYHLGVQEWQLGATAMPQFGHFFFGAGGHLSQLSLSRATRDQAALGSGIGVEAVAGFDLFQLGERGADSLFVEGRLGLDGIVGLDKSLWFWGPSLMGGFRF